MRKFVVTSILVGLLSLSFMAVAAQSTQVDVTPGDMKGWVFLQEGPTGPGTGALVDGPSEPPIGSGSVHFKIEVGSSVGEAILLDGYNGVRLDEISKLSYSAYRASGGPALAIALQFNADYNLADEHNNFQGRLVYEPHLNGLVVSNQWQPWDALDSGEATWWMTMNPATSNVLYGFNTPCPQASPCTLNQILTIFPNAGIRAVDGPIILKAGGGWGLTGFDGNVDALSIGVNDVDTTYNFEAAPTDKDQCKSGGWAEFNNPTFKNQGECVSSIASGGKAGGKK